MTNKEKYKRAFSTLHASDKISLEVEIMENKKSLYKMRKAFAACAAVVLAFGSMTVAYAADLGGIQEKITTWFHGEQMEMDVTDDGNGNYTYTYTDQDGKIHEGGGGGVALDAFGNQIPLSAEDVLSELGNGVEVKEDGSIWFYYYENQVEVTELFDEGGICRIAVMHDGKRLYCEIEKDADSGWYDEEREIGCESPYSLSVTEEPEDADSYTLVE